MLSIFQNEYIVVDYIDISEEDIYTILGKGYNIGFANEEIVAYLTIESGKLYMIFVNKDGKTFSKYKYTERLIQGLYKKYEFIIIVGFTVSRNVLNKHLEDDKRYLICKSLIDLRCTFCDNKSCESHKIRNIN